MGSLSHTRYLSSLVPMVGLCRASSSPSIAPFYSMSMILDSFCTRFSSASPFLIVSRY